ncbi:AAA family ATPase [Candidatus Omnitrophota bacterium]
MKIAITGKGGVGKTTVTAGLASIINEDGKKVIVLDCDPDMNLGLSLGFPNYDKITPISEMKELIAERTEVESLDKPQTFFKLNPKVDDIPEKFSAEHNGIKLLIMGKVDKAGGGCMCPENTFIKSLLAHLIINDDQVVILDMVAGTEHIGRATARSVDAFIIVAEATQMSVSTAKRIKNLSSQLGIKKIFFVGNKINSDSDKDFLKKELNGDFLGFISYNNTLEQNRGKFQFDKLNKEEFKSIYKELSACAKAA